MQNATANATRLRAAADAALRRQCYPEARQAFRALVDAAPDDLNARLNLSNVQMALGELSDAVAVLEGTLARLGTDPVATGETARQLLAAGETRAAHECLQRPEVAGAESLVAVRILSRVAWNLGDVEQALGFQARAMDAGADSPQDRHFHAMLLQFTGRIAEAEQALDACLRSNPGFGDAALARSRLRRQKPAANHVAWLERQLDAARSENVTRASFLFALFKELDDLGRHAEAWPALEQANALMHRLHPYAEQADTALHEATMARCGTEFCRVDEERSPGAGPVPIFIVGMPRSGTTLLDRMLGNHSDAVSAGELPDFLIQWQRHGAADGATDPLRMIRDSDRIDFAALGRAYLHQTAWRADEAGFFIDKMPNNFQLLGFIRRALPQARILLIHREPVAVCFSNYKAMFGPHSVHSYDLELLARFCQRHEQMRMHWRQVLGDAVLEVDYAELVTAAEPTMRRVLAFCGLPFEPACIDPASNPEAVSTPSSAQVREGIHQRALEDWQHYADQLAGLRRQLEAAGLGPG